MTVTVSTITGNGQVRIPAEVLRRLGLAPGDQIAFVIEDDGTVALRPMRHSVSSLRGIVPALAGRESPDFEDQIDEAFAEGTDTIVREQERA